MLIFYHFLIFWSTANFYISSPISYILNSPYWLSLWFANLNCFATSPTWARRRWNTVEQDKAYWSAIMASLMLALDQTARACRTRNDLTQEQREKAIAELKAMTERVDPLMAILGLWSERTVWLHPPDARNKRARGILRTRGWKPRASNILSSIPLALSPIL